jgi:hypothetical protein
MELHCRAKVDASVRAELDSIVATHDTLEAVVKWGFAQESPVLVSEVVKQDEFCHDAIVPWRGALWLVYGTT